MNKMDILRLKYREHLTTARQEWEQILFDVFDGALKDMFGKRDLYTNLTVMLLIPFSANEDLCYKICYCTDGDGEDWGDTIDIPNTQGKSVSFFEISENISWLAEQGIIVIDSGDAQDEYFVDLRFELLQGQS